MDDETQQADNDKRGGYFDWPVPVLIVGLVLMLWGAGSGSQFAATIGLLAAIFGGISLMIRRGAFTPRK